MNWWRIRWGGPWTEPWAAYLAEATMRAITEEHRKRTDAFLTHYTHLHHRDQTTPN